MGKKYGVLGSGYSIHQTYNHMMILTPLDRSLTNKDRWVRLIKESKPVMARISLKDRSNFSKQMRSSKLHISWILLLLRRRVVMRPNPFMKFSICSSPWNERFSSFGTKWWWWEWYSWGWSWLFSSLLLWCRRLNDDNEDNDGGLSPSVLRLSRINCSVIIINNFNCVKKKRARLLNGIVESSTIFLNYWYCCTDIELSTRMVSRWVVGLKIKQKNSCVAKRERCLEWIWFHVQREIISEMLMRYFSPQSKVQSEQRLLSDLWLHRRWNENK